jgi:hypothetical protein
MGFRDFDDLLLQYLVLGSNPTIVQYSLYVAIVGASTTEPWVGKDFHDHT